MDYALTKKGLRLVQRLALEQPFDLADMKNNSIWQGWALKAVCGDDPPSDCDPVAAHEGYMWGKEFNAE